MKKLKNTMAVLALSTVTLTLTSCGGGGGGGGGGGVIIGGGGGGGPTLGYRTSPDITADRFVDALNDVDGAVFDYSEIVLYEDETYRTYEPDQEEWFVFYDAKYSEYKAVSLQYLRAIEYYDYYTNDYFATADEFRYIENDDIAFGDLNGDFWGDDYEVVDYDSYTDSYWGRNSGYEYEDQQGTKDVSLMAASQQELAFYNKASKISFTYEVNAETALSLVTLGHKVNVMKANKAELSVEDQNALMADIEKISGVTASEVISAFGDEAKKAELLEKVAKNLGTKKETLENKILPELLNVQL